MQQLRMQQPRNWPLSRAGGSLLSVRPSQFRVGWAVSVFAPAFRSSHVQRRVDRDGSLRLPCACLIHQRNAEGVAATCAGSRHLSFRLISFRFIDTWRRLVEQPGSVAGARSFCLSRRRRRVQEDGGRRGHTLHQHVPLTTGQFFEPLLKHRKAVALGHSNVDVVVSQSPNLAFQTADEQQPSHTT